MFDGSGMDGAAKNGGAGGDCELNGCGEGLRVATEGHMATQLNGMARYVPTLRMRIGVQWVFIWLIRIELNRFII